MRFSKKSKVVVLTVTVIILLAVISCALLARPALQHKQIVSKLSDCVKQSTAMLDSAGKKLTCTKPDGSTVTTPALPPIQTSSMASSELAWKDLADNSSNVLQVAIAKQWPTGCTSDADSPEARLGAGTPVTRAGDYVKTPLSCLNQQNNEATDVFIKVSGHWEHIGNMDLPYGCEKVLLYNIPQQIAGSRCMDKNNIQHAIN